MKRAVIDDVGRAYTLMLDNNMFRVYDGGLQVACVFLENNELPLVDKIETYEDAIALVNKGTRSKIF